MEEVKINLSRISNRGNMSTDDIVNFMLDNGYTVIVNDYDGTLIDGEMVCIEYDMSDLVHLNENNNKSIWDLIKSQEKITIQS